MSAKESITICVTACARSRILRLQEGSVADVKEHILDDRILSGLVSGHTYTLKLKSKEFTVLCDLDDEDIVLDGSHLIIQMV